MVPPRAPSFRGMTRRVFSVRFGVSAVTPARDDRFSPYGDLSQLA